jgi:hypothetical protein
MNNKEVNMLLGHKPIASIGNKIKKGDLVRLSQIPHEQRTSFKVVSVNPKSQDQYCNALSIKATTGIVLFEDDDSWGMPTYHVAFGSTVIRAHEDYFDKVEKTLNKTNN